MHVIRIFKKLKECTFKNLLFQQKIMNKCISVISLYISAYSCVLMIILMGPLRIIYNDEKCMQHMILKEDEMIHKLKNPLLIASASIVIPILFCLFCIPKFICSVLTLILINILSITVCILNMPIVKYLSELNTDNICVPKSCEPYVEENVVNMCVTVESLKNRFLFTIIHCFLIIFASSVTYFACIYTSYKWTICNTEDEE